QAQRVRERGEPEARPQLLGDRGPANEMAALEDERLQTRLREIGAVHQAVVAGPDDDRVIGALAGAPAVPRVRTARALAGRAPVGAVAAGGAVGAGPASGLPRRLRGGALRRRRRRLRHQAVLRSGL